MSEHWTTRCALSENAVPGGGALGTWLAILVSNRMKTKAAANVAILFITPLKPPGPHSTGLQVRARTSHRIRMHLVPALKFRTVQRLKQGKTRQKSSRTGLGPVRLHTDDCSSSTGSAGL